MLPTTLHVLLLLNFLTCTGQHVACFRSNMFPKSCLVYGSLSVRNLAEVCGLQCQRIVHECFHLYNCNFLFSHLSSEPSAVVGLSLNVNASHLIVTWIVPMTPNGMVRYDVILSGVNLVNNMPIDISSSSMNVTETMYTVAHSSLPYSNYTAMVTAFTDGGFGPVSTVTEQTPVDGE